MSSTKSMSKMNKSELYKLCQEQKDQIISLQFHHNTEMEEVANVVGVSKKILKLQDRMTALQCELSSQLADVIADIQILKNIFDEDLHDDKHCLEDLDKIENILSKY